MQGNSLCACPELLIIKNHIIKWELATSFETLIPYLSARFAVAAIPSAMCLQYLQTRSVLSVSLSRRRETSPIIPPPPTQLSTELCSVKFRQIIALFINSGPPSSESLCRLLWLQPLRLCRLVTCLKLLIFFHHGCQIGIFLKQWKITSIIMV
jgi:hypothetical protein